MVLAKVAAGVGGLYDHLLAVDGAGCKCQSRDGALAMVKSEIIKISLLVASAAPVALSLPSQLDSSETICQLIVNRPRTLVGAHVCLSAILTAILSSHIRERVV